MNRPAGARACCALIVWLLTACARGQYLPPPPPPVSATDFARTADFLEPEEEGTETSIDPQTFDDVVGQGDAVSQDNILSQFEAPSANWTGWNFHWLPGNLIYPAYLAGAKESRFASFWAHDQDEGGIWDIALGGRAGIARFGTRDCRPDGWQLDMEGAAFPRLDLDHRDDVMATDFRFGMPLTYGDGPLRVKLAFYHLSSHVGDEYLLRNPTFNRINYSRNALVWGNSYYFNDDTRGYVEVEFATDSDIAKPWAYQFGLDYSPSGMDGRLSAPFAALNVHLREEVNFGGNVVLQAGWQWRAHPYGRMLRAGAEYFNGKSDQFEFYTRTEQKVGLGIWYDF